MIIESAQNPTFKKLKSLQKKKGILKEQFTLVAGQRIIKEALTSRPHPQCQWVCSNKHLESGFAALDIEKIVLKNELFREIDEFGTDSPILKIPLPAIETFENWDQKSNTLVLCLGDPLNMGTLLRTALGLGIDQALLCEEACFPFTPRVIRSSSGYALNFKFAKGPSVKKLLDPALNIQTQNFVALDKGGTALSQLEWPSPLYFLVGEEGQGVPREYLGKRAEIPLENSVESLNAAIAGAIGLHAWRTGSKGASL